MKAKHTPGPWKAELDGSGPWFVRAGNGNIVCQAGNQVDDEEEANVQMITAAPDMYEAGKECLAWMLTIAKDHPDAYAKCRTLDTALSKVEGRAAK